MNYIYSFSIMRRKCYDDYSNTLSFHFIQPAFSHLSVHPFNPIAVQSLACSSVYYSIHSFIYLFILSFVHLPAHPFKYTDVTIYIIYLLIHPSILPTTYHPSAHPSIQLHTHSYNYSSAHPLILPSIHPFTQQPTHPSIHPLPRQPSICPSAHRIHEHEQKFCKQMSREILDYFGSCS